ncbi:flavocytochrome c [Adlercreutzia aquisgranensis]|uniref:flavocytochrome c n=1 Tax=Adlercreutzia aquisgranensis TaxID=2941323 RepID=UPI0020415C8C|nr:flavocytochrome c [Adlercreutzia aquisgranensis]
MKGLSRRQFLAGGAMAALGGTMALAGCAPQTHGESQSSGQQSSTRTEGAAGTATAIGTGMGKHGNFDVEVSVTDGAIDRITVLDSLETPGLGDVAMEKMTKAIIDGQTLNVDTVSGATLSSMAFMNAVSSALDTLGEDSDEWKDRAYQVWESDVVIPTTADVVVVGAGGAGFAAAITAANEGKSVVLMDKMGVFGGDTALSGGEMAVPGNWIQVTQGVEDTPDKLVEDMLVGGDNKGDPELVAIIANGALDSANWLTYEGGISWKHDLMQFGGHKTKRSIIPITHSGSEMTTKLTNRAEGIDNLVLVGDTKATELLTNSDGAVTGVKYQNTVTGEEGQIDCKAVVLTTGGFGSNVEMRVQYNPEMDEGILSTDSVAAQGDGLVMAQNIGADLIDMEYIQTYPVCDPETGALLYVGDVRLENYGILVNEEGDRFVEELGRRDVISNAIKSQADGVAYLLFDQKAADNTGLLETHADEYENSEARGVIVKGDTIEEVAKAQGVDPAELRATVEQWNGYCAEGSDPDFSYSGTEMNTIEEGPFYLMACKPAVHYTMGGLHITPEAEVLTVDEEVIPGLYAAGEVAGHKMGTNRLGSCSMTDIYTFGRIAGKNASDYAA